MKHKSRKHHTNEHKVWATENLQNYKSFKELKEAFEKRFEGHSLSECTVWRTWGLPPYGDSRKYTNEQVQFIKSLKKHRFREDAYEEFVKRFGPIKSYRQFKDKTNAMDIHFENKTIFKPHDKRLEKPIGAESTVSSNNGKPYIYTKTSESEWRRKSVVVYEKFTNTKVDDKTHIVVHIDGNNENFEPENLCLISRAALGKFNCYKKCFSNIPPKALVYLCELESLAGINKTHPQGRCVAT